MLEIDTLRRWKLNHQLEEDRARLRDLETTDSCVCRGGLQKVVKRRKTTSAPRLATSEGSSGEGSESNFDTTLLQQQQEGKPSMIKATAREKELFVKAHMSVRQLPPRINALHQQKLLNRRTHGVQTPTPWPS